MLGENASSNTPVSEVSAPGAEGPGEGAGGYGGAAGRRQLWAALAAVVPLALLTCLMAVRGNFGFSVPVGFVCVLVSAAGIIVLFRGSEQQASRPTREGDVRATLKALLLLGLTTLAFVLVLRGAVSGNFPAPLVTSALLVPALFLGNVVAAFRVARELGWVRGEPSLSSRYGFWLMVVHAVVYLPLLGSFSLIDPWETHYGEVAREMLVKDDWISLWWAQDGWFWSKPVLDFWMQGLSFSLLGVQFLPDQMLAGMAQGRTPHPEWAARVPVFLMTAGACYAFYKALARSVHPRAGFLAALVLTTTPYWFLLSHQTMTDMPYVAALVTCLSCFLLGSESNADAPGVSTQFRLGRLQFSLAPSHALLGLLLLLALPQICYLVSRNLTLDLGTGALSVHADQFSAGSGGGNCGLPGNQSCRPATATYPTGQPALLACSWLFLLLWLVRDLQQETRTRTLYYYGAWLALALSVMAKGAPGLVLPLFVIVLFLGATKRWRVLLELRPGALLIVFAIVALPWHVQMLLRHGHGFIDRLLLHDMYKRAFDHVHDTNEGVDVSFRYYLWQLGYGLFPWSGLAIAGVLDWLRRQFDRNQEPSAPGSSAATLMGLWFIAAFSLFTLSGTKFHHYILPAVPPLAALVGLSLHELLGKDASRRDLLTLSGITLGVWCALAGLTLLGGGSLDGSARSGPISGWSQLWGGGLLVLALGVTLASAREAVRHRVLSAQPSVLPGNLLLFGLIPALALGLVGRDLLTQHGERLPGQVLLMQLFTYQYKRPWPEHLDFDASLLGFTGLGALLCLCLVPRATRALGLVGFCALGSAWAAWGVNVYLVRAAPHWGQRETIAEYYRVRTNTDAPLVAFQMNWKGENFYTGNRLAAFVRSGEPFKNWLTEQRARGVRTLYFTTEPSRFAALKRELGNHKKFQILTNDRQNNKFALARVDL